jgi:hypothetical protein
MRPAGTPLAAVAVTILIALSGCGGDDRAAPSRPGSAGDRHEEVARRGAEVMPFSLDRTMHVFTPDDRGGVQIVHALDGSDDHEVDAIRAHLRAARDAFAAGDFSDPAAIHGPDMPGLAELSAGRERIEVVYEEIDAGARLTYRTDDADLLAALHAWFEAQLSDHGAHARSGHAHSHDSGAG